MQTETLLHIALKFQVDHACFLRGEAGTNFGQKVEQEERNKETEHPQ